MLFMDYGFGAPVKKAVAKSAPMVKRAVAVARSAPRPAPRPAPPRKPPAAKAAPKAKPTPDAGVTKLQHTLNSLAQRTGDSALTLKVDGLIGPKTAAATNRAMVKYGAVAGAPAEVRTGRLTAAQVKDLAGDLAFFVEKAVEKSLPKTSPAVAKKAEAQKQAAIKKVAATRSDAIIALQRALRTLGVIVEDGALKALAIDGLIGPKTTAAVNRVMTRYVPKPPALYASGTLTQQAVVASASELTSLITGAARAQQTAKQAPAAAGRKPAAKKPGDIPRITIPAPYETAKERPPAPEIEEPEITVPEPKMPSKAVIRPPPSQAAVAPDAVYPPDQRPGAEPQPPGPAEEKKFPWPWVIAGGAGVVGLVAVTVLIARKKKR